MSPFLFLLVIDWTMKETTNRHPVEQLEDLDLADDIALLSYNNQQMQDKTAKMMKNSVKLGLKPCVDKTNVMKINCTSSRPIKISGRHLEEIT